MAGIFDAAVHMRAAALAGIALDRRGRIDDRELVPVGGDAQSAARNDGYLWEGGAGRFPALAAAADMVMRAVAAHGDFDAVAGTIAVEFAAPEARCARLHAIVHGRMNRYAHVSVLPWFIWKKKKQHRSFCPAAEFTTPHQGGLVSRIQ